MQEPSDNLVIYGHHMSNGSMFAHLEKFKSKDFWSEHRMITFNTLTDKQEYEIVAVFRTVVYTDSPEAFKFYRFSHKYPVRCICILHLQRWGYPSNTRLLCQAQVRCSQRSSWQS